jgi:hypothetical protein
MTFRLSTKLATKLKVTPTKVLPLDENPFADWSGHVFTADRTQFVIVTNTASLYSTVLYGRGIANDGHFIERALGSLREFMEDDGLSFIYQRFIAPASSMNDLIVHAKMWLTEGELSPHDTAFKLNDIPFSPFKYRKPREVFTGLASQCDG